MCNSAIRAGRKFIFIHWSNVFDLSGHNNRPMFLVLDCPMTLQSSRSLDTLSDLKLQRLEAELEGARHEAQGACQREEELKGECEGLREELRELQSNQRQRVSNKHTHMLNDANRNYTLSKLIFA